MVAKTKIFLTIDLWFRGWNVPGRPGKVWLYVQPWIEYGDGLTSGLKGYLEGLGDAAMFSYEIASARVCGSQNLLPVNLPGEASIKVQIESSGAGSSEVRTRQNLRGETFIVRDAGKLFELNGRFVKPDVGVKDEIEREQRKLIDRLKGLATGRSFAGAWNSQLKDYYGQIQKQPDWDKTIAGQLRLAFLTGTRYRINAECMGEFTDTKKLSLMKLSPLGNPASVPADQPWIETNFHSLSGLLFEIGTQADTTFWAGVNKAEVCISRPDGTECGTADFCCPGEGYGEIVKELFQSISRLSPAPYGFAPVAWEEFGRRVQGAQRYTSFRYSAVSNGADKRHLFLAPLTMGGDETTSFAPKLECRIEVPDNVNVLEAPVSLPNLSMNPVLLFNGVLKSYGRDPEELAGTNAKRSATVLQLICDGLVRALQTEAIPLKAGRIAIIRPDGQTVSSEQIEEIGRFSFPWDQARAGAGGTLLFWGNRGLVGPVKVLVALGPEDRQMLVWTGQPQDGGRVSRWSGQTGVDPLEASGFEVKVPDGVFGQLKVTDASAASIERCRFLVAFPGDYEFKLSQSAHAEQGVVEIQVPAGDCLASVATDPALEEYRLDQRNYQTLQVYVEGDGTREARSATSNLLPSIRETIPATAVEKQVFQFGYERPAFPTEWRTNRALREAVRNLYRQLGSGPATRKLDYSVLHVDGTEIELPLKSEVLNIFDFPAAMPRDGGDDPKNRNDVKEMEVPAVLGVQYECGSNGNSPDALVFLLNQRALDIEGHLDRSAKKDPKFLQHVVAGWMSIGELAYADRIVLRWRGRAFDIHQSVEKAKAGGYKPNVADGLRRVRAVGAVVSDEGWYEHDITSSLRSKATDLLSGATLLTQPEPLRFHREELPPLAGGRIRDVCNIAQFGLRVIRKRERTPLGVREIGKWWLSFERSFDKEYENLKRKNTPAATGPGASTLEAWLTSLSERAQVLVPTATARKEAAAFLSVVGGPSGGRAVTKSDSKPPAEGDVFKEEIGNWLTPGGYKKPEAGEVDVVLCPFGFVPTRSDSRLGSDSSVAVAQWFESLSVLLRNDNKWLWDKNQNALMWTAHFERLRDYAKPLDDFFEFIVDGLLRPQPDLLVGNPKVREIVAAFKKPSTDEDKTFQKEVSSFVKSMLWKDPSTFVSTRALILSNVRPAKGNATIPADFFGIRLSKNGLLRKVGTAKYTDGDQYTISDLLVGLAESKFLSVVDPLDDMRYGTEVLYTGMRIDTLQAVVELLAKEVRSPGATCQADGRTNIEIARVNLPYCADDVAVSDLTTSPVALAARRAVSSPVHTFTGRLAEAQDFGKWSALMLDLQRKGSALSLSDLRSGQVRAVSENVTSLARLRLVKASLNVAKRGPALDEYILSSAFIVKGNEVGQVQRVDDVGQLARTVLGNDSFHFQIFRDTPGNPCRGSAQGDGVTDDEFRRGIEPLVKNLTAAELEDPIKVLFLGTTELPVRPSQGWPISKLLRAEKTPPCDLSKVDELPRALVVPGKDAQPGSTGIQLQIRNPTYAETTVRDVVLFRVEAARAGADDLSRDPEFLLLVSFVVPVWSGWGITLIQSRNRELAMQGKCSAPLITEEFWSTAVGISDQRPFQAVNLDVSPRKKPVSVKRMSSLDELMVSLVPEFPVGAAAKGRWRSNDLAILIFHNQEVQRVVQVLESREQLAMRKQGSEVKRPDSRGRFPLGVWRVREGDVFSSSVEWFEREYGDFSVDLVWTNRQNEQFFRIEVPKVAFS